MSRLWADDIHHMHDHYGFHEWIQENKDNKELMRKMLEFRLNFLGEELLEARKNLTVDNSEEVVDAMIDLIVVAIGTLDLFEVNAYQAWNEVHTANMAKKRGIKPGRPNPLGIPDLMKPSGWKRPDHTGNHGLLENIK